MIRRSPMKRGKRINPKRHKPRRKRDLFNTGHGIRLYGKARSARRAEIFERAGGRCEERFERFEEWPGCGRVFVSDRCPNRPTEWSHKRHGVWKCDCYSPTAQGACSIASCSDCHKKRHAGGNGKPIAVRKRDIKMEVV